MKGVLVAGALLILLGAGWWYYQDVQTAENPRTPASSSFVETHEESPPPVSENPGASIGEENMVEFRCAGGKSITAVFARDILGLTLSDGRQITMRQAVSGSGIRYLNNTETIEFRGKGEEAYLQEGDTITYAECVAKD